MAKILRLSYKFLVVLFLFFTLVVGSVSAETWYVDDDGGADFTRINDAINASIAEDMIIVKDGMYTENVDVNKRLTIRSENGAASTTILGKNPNGHVFHVTEDYTNISGFKVEGATKPYTAGI